MILATSIKRRTMLYYAKNLQHPPKDVVVLPSPNQVPQSFLGEVTWIN